MTQYIDKSAVVAEIKGYISNYKEIVAKINRNDSTWVDSVSMIDAKIDVLQHLLSFLNTLEVKEVQEEPISNDLEEAARKIDTRHSHISGDTYYANDAWFFKKGAQWQKENLWKPADGEDLPEIDKEVIALIQPCSNYEHLRVVFAHRPNKYTTWIERFGEKKIVEVERYGKGEWNIPNVKWWLDCELPKMEE